MNVYVNSTNQTKYNTRFFTNRKTHKKYDKVFILKGPSPDEIALVDFAKKMDYVFQGVSKKTLQLEIFKENYEFELLHLFEFNSERKRMSIIIRDHDVIKLYIKGADNVIKERLEQKFPQPFVDKISFSLDDFSKQGLRTLCVAFKIITEEEYREFEEKYEELLNVENRQKRICIEFLLKIKFSIKNS